MNRLRVAFMGSPDFAVPCLRLLVEICEVRLVVTQPDKPAGRGQKQVPPAVKVAALGAGLAVAQPEKLKTPPLAEVLAPLALDLIVVVAYGRILPQAILDVPRLGCWNVHGSLLPKYRGAAPIQWAVIEGERETGVTLMQMEAGLDTGPMLLRRALPIADDDTAGSMYARLAPVGAELLGDGIDRLRAGTLVAERQDDARATLAPMLDKQDGRVDWNQPARRVGARIRGVDPWPGAFTALEGEVLKLWMPTIVDGAADARPGEVLDVGKRGLVVACADGGAVVLAEGQLPGRKRMPIAALVAGRPIAAGSVLGQGAA